MIPKIIHQIWIQGISNVPENIRKHMDTCVSVNKNFKFVYWDDTKIIQLLKKHKNDELYHIYTQLDSFASKADLARYLIMYHYGGWYVDTDYNCFKPLDVFDTANLVYIPYKKLKTGSMVFNGLFACSKNHPLMQIVLDKLVRRNYKSRKLTLFKTTYKTGTNLFYSSIQKYHKQYPDDASYIIVSLDQLFPRDALEDNEPSKYKHIAFMDHTNSCSWNPLIRIYGTIQKFINPYYIVIAFLMIIILILTISILNHKRKLKIING